MAHFHTANRASYQTYAHPLAGGKRKRISTSNDIEPVESDVTFSPARSMKSRDNKDKYNPKYMAEMCFSAYKVRLHEAGLQQYTIDVANDWREHLVEMFSHAALRGAIKQDAVARHMVPRLVLLLPRNNEEKKELVKDFAKHYEDVRHDMMVISKTMLSGDEDSIAEVRECLYGLHKTLAEGARWRKILPYLPLPLPLHRLRALRNLIEYSRPYQFLHHLVTEIDDIESWLTFLPIGLNTLIFPAGLVNAVKGTQQQVTEDKIVKTSIGPNAQEMAEYREQKAKRQRLEKKEQARQQEQTYADKLQKIEAEQIQMKKDIKSLELAVTEKRAQEIAKKHSEAAALAKREKSYQDQISLNTIEIKRLNAELDNLAGGQAQKMQPKVTSTPLSPIDSVQLSTSTGSSFSSNQTANSSIHQPQSSLGTSFGSSFAQPGSFEQTLHQRAPEDDGVPMEDVQGIGPSQQHPTKSDQVGFPEARIAGQPNTFGAHISSGAPSQLLGLSNSNFKSACPAYKNGHCPAGKSCMMPHSACKFWVKGNCRYGGNCIRSHDPFFLKDATSRGQQRQSSQVDQMIVDSDPTPRSSAFSQENPFQRGRQGRAQASQASNIMSLPDHQALPTGPHERPSIMGRITKDGQPIISYGSNIASIKDGNTNRQQGILSDAIQGPRATIGSKKVACKNNLKGRCNKGLSCQYAHEPCPRFIKGTCFADDQCRRSHDPLFLRQGSSSNSAQQSSKSPTGQQPSQTRIEQSLDEVLQAKGGDRKEKYGKPFQVESPIRNQRPQDHLEQSLDDIIKTAGRGRENQARLPQSETPCKWEKTQGGCTNGSCPYKHDSRKTSDPKASRGTFGIPNLFSSIGSILRGNRQ
ncbi:hypothetical protein AA0113_g6979 [Alternaria arborescens]|uniref:C3H1-type domain-containing protein n=1 Tax=Alternaria arborescens TaxID=156630 RepID=A0A4Q4RSU9_9PLEO|nr:hypothetical protein AA0111_g8821 [Alternaria arborescens]RYN25212.1 hypothetical protein AA0112_g8698 [Alternaria arborescens]RYO23942.1 hypothetical protein AA0111_g8821 [Alternaria arborescens]RYO60202.1 hypothetical protein AA0113_g6979 [Alternaria arborescens]